MAQTLELVRNIIIRSTAEGTQETAQALNRIVQAQEEVARSSEGVARATAEEARERASAIKAHDAYRSKIDAAHRLVKQFERQVEAMNVATMQDAGERERATRTLQEWMMTLGRAMNGNRDFIGGIDAVAKAMIEGRKNTDAMRSSASAMLDSFRDTQAVLRQEAQEIDNVNKAMAQYAAMNAKRIADNEAFEESQRKAAAATEARAEAERRVNQAAYDRQRVSAFEASLGIGGPAATSRGAGASALIEREKQLADERKKLANEVATALKAQEAQLTAARKRAADEVAKALRQEEAEYDRLNRAVNEHMQKLIPLEHETRRHEQAINDINEAYKRGIITLGQHGQMLQKEGERTAAIQRDYNGFRGATGQQMTQLSYQINDIFTSLASGQSILTTLGQQGGQIVQIFQDRPGSLVGALKQTAMWLLRMLPIIAPLGAAFAALGASIYGAFRISGEMQQMENALRGIGRGVGITAEALNKLATESAEAGDVSVSQARRMAAEFAKTGKIAPTMISGLIAVSRDYAVTTGQNLEDAIKELGKAFSDPAAGAKILQERLGLLDNETAKAIDTDLRHNRVLEAKAKMLDALRGSVDKHIDSMRPYEKIWDRITKGASNAADAMAKPVLRVMGDESKTDEVARIEKTIKALEREKEARKDVSEFQESASVGRSKRDIQDEIDALEKRRKAIQDTTKAEDANAKKKQETLQVNQSMFDAYEITNRNDEEHIKRQKELTADQTKLQDALNKAKAAGRPYDENIGAQLNATTQALKTLIPQEERLRQERELTRREREATSDEERKAIAVDRARLGMAGERISEEKRIRAELAAGAQAEKELAQATRMREKETARATKSTQEQSTAMRESGAAAAAIAAKEAQARKELEDESGTATKEAVRARAKALALKDTEDQIKALNEQTDATRTNNKAEQDAIAASEKAGESTAKRNERLERLRKQLANAKQAQDAFGQETEEHQKAVTAANEADEKSMTLLKQRAALDLRDEINDETKQILAQADSIGKSVEQMAVENSVREAKNQLQRQGIDLDSAEAKGVLDAAVARGQAIATIDRMTQAYKGMMDAQKESLSMMSSFVKELLTGSGKLDEAFKSLGKSYVNNVLDALIQGTGPMAGTLGTAPSEKGGVGGIGALFSSENMKKFENAVKEGTGSAWTGLFGGEKPSASVDKLGGEMKTSTNILGKGINAVAGLAAAYGAGRSTTNALQGAGMGALAGAAAGASFGPIGIAVGAVAGAGLGFLGSGAARRQQQREQRLAAFNAYVDALPDISQMRAAFRGDTSQAGLMGQVAEAQAQMAKAIQVSAGAFAMDQIAGIQNDFNTFVKRIRDEFVAGFDGMIQALESGMGPDSPFVAAKQNVVDLGKQLKQFITDTQFAGDPAMVDRAIQASFKYMYSLLDSAKELSVVQQRLAEINGTAAGLQTALVELGASAEGAAAAINEKLNKALNDLRNEFVNDLQRKINELTDRGWINEVADLFEEIRSLQEDAASLGVGGGEVSTYFRVAAQDIVDSAELTGAAFQELLIRFPELQGVVHEFSAELEQTAEEIKRALEEIERRRLSYQNRLFAAQNDPSTIEGALAAFDRQAMQERQAEMEAGGQAMADLEAALAAERYNIIKDFNQRAIDEEKRIAEQRKQQLKEAQDFLSGIARNIRQFIDSLKAGPQSPLSPQARLQSAQAAFTTQYQQAAGGDRDALSGITGYAGDVLEAARAYYASGPQFQQLFASITQQLEALPTLVSPEELIVDAIEASTLKLVTEAEIMKSTLQAALLADNPQAIATALGTYFNKLDVNTDGLLTLQELKDGLKAVGVALDDGKLRQWLQTLDTNGDGQLSQLELIKGSQQLSYGKFTDIAYSNNQIAIDGDNVQALLNAIATLQDTSIGWQRSIDYWSNQNVAQTNIGNSILTAQNAILDATRMNTRNTWTAAANLWARNVRDGISSYYPAADWMAEGGKVEGPGSGTSDSIRAMLSNGEFVLRASSAAKIGYDVLERMNDNGMLPILRPAHTGGGDTALLYEIRSLRQEVAQLRTDNNRITALGAEHVAAAVGSKAEAESEARRVRRAAAA